MLLDQALAPATNRAYSQQVKNYKLFCKSINESWPQALKNETVELWLTYKKNLGSSIGTIKSHLSALRHYCLRHNITAKLSSPRITLILKGIQRNSNPSKLEKKLVTQSHLRRLIDTSQLVLGNGPEHFRFSSMITLAFYGFLRPSEFCTSPAGHHIKRNNVKISSNAKKIKIILTSFKHSVGPKTIKINKTNNSTCPVRWLKKYLKNLKNEKSEPLFKVSVKEFQSMMSRLKKQAAIKSHITPHCLRHGGASWASSQGWTETQIKAHGRWKSNAYTCYVRAT